MAGQRARHTSPQPTTQRRIGSEHSATRTALLDAAQALMVEGGYASVTSRRVAAAAGVKPQLVHYYFRTMDDLFLAVFRRGAELNLARQAEAMASPQPLHALWHFSCDPAGTTLTFEFTALANHRKAIRAEIAEFARQFRHNQQAALATALANAGVDHTTVTPLVAVVVGTAISRVLSMENTLGLDDGHEEVLEWVERWLDEIEPAPTPHLEAT